MEFFEELIEASKNIEEYQVLLDKSKVKQDFLLNLLAFKEAVDSSRIEGIRTTFDEILEYDVDKKQKTNDDREVHNYYKALKRGEMILDRLPISTRLFQKLHNILMSDKARGRNRAPGEYRSVQNFIGPEGCTIETASFVPPPPQEINSCMSNLEKYINNPSNDDLNHLVRIAIIHAQFEAIHPFLDGNGRIGRILIPLYLYNFDIIDSPSFFISGILEKNKYKYYQLLNGTRKKDGWNDWIRFFLKSANKQAQKNIEIIEEIDKLYEKDLGKAQELTNSNNMIDIVTTMFKKPVFTVKTMTALTEIPDSICRRCLSKLEKERIIFSDNKKRNKKYYYYNLLDLFR